MPDAVVAPAAGTGPKKKNHRRAALMGLKTGPHSFNLDGWKGGNGG